MGKRYILGCGCFLLFFTMDSPTTETAYDASDNVVIAIAPPDRTEMCVLDHWAEFFSSDRMIMLCGDDFRISRVSPACSTTFGALHNQGAISTPFHSIVGQDIDTFHGHTSGHIRRMMTSLPTGRTHRASISIGDTDMICSVTPLEAHEGRQYMVEWEDVTAQTRIKRDMRETVDSVGIIAGAASSHIKQKTNGMHTKVSDIQDAAARVQGQNAACQDRVSTMMQEERALEDRRIEMMHALQELLDGLGKHGETHADATNEAPISESMRHMMAQIGELTARVQASVGDMITHMESEARQREVLLQEVQATRMQAEQTVAEMKVILSAGDQIHRDLREVQMVGDSLKVQADNARVMVDTSMDFLQPHNRRGNRKKIANAA